MIRYSLNLLILISLLLTSSVFAQFPYSGFDLESNTNSDSRQITVSGSAEVLVPPSQVVITFGVETFNVEMNPARTDNDKRISGILALAKELKVDARDIQTDHIYIEPVYERRSGELQQRLIHYVVRKTAVIRLKDVSKFEQLLSSGLDRGATHVLDIKFEVDDLKKHREKARSDAIKAAKEKAELLTADLGAKLGRVLNIREHTPSWYQNYGNSWNRRYGGNYGSNVMSQVSSSSGDGNASSENSSFSAGQISINASVSVVFEIE